MKLTFNLILLLMFSLSQFDHKAIRIAETIGSDTLQHHSTKYVILPLSLRDSGFTGFDNSYKVTTLSEVEIKQLENLIEITVNDYNKQCVPSFSIKKTSRYYKQIVPAINNKGEKEVWIQCFLDLIFKDDMKERIKIVDDGGSSVFMIKINLTTKKILRFGINGVG